VTVVGVLIGALLLRERLSGVQVLGGAGIVTGCALVLGLLPARRRLGRRPRPVARPAGAPAMPDDPE
jgi:drug/metabolite transporter (DMT)-like permease